MSCDCEICVSGSSEDVQDALIHLLFRYSDIGLLQICALLQSFTQVCGAEY